MEEESVIEVFVRDGDDDTKVEVHSLMKLLANNQEIVKKSEQDSESENEVDAFEESSSQKRKQDTTDENSTTKKKCYTQKYRKEWESEPAFKYWLSESVLGNCYFYCKFCKNNNKCGRTEIEKHMVCKKHINNSKTCGSRVQRKFSFRGLLCPVFTPFKSIKEQDINVNIIQEYADYMDSCGIKGILINDLIGEGTSLTHGERMKVTEVWATACERNKQHLMVQVGGVPLKEVQEMVYHAEKKKVGSIVILPDVNNKPKDHFDLMRYIKLVADCANTVPILYHHNPSKTGVNINMQSFLTDILGEIDNFVGIIFSDNNLHEAISALHVNQNKFTVFLGTDEIMVGAFASGFNSVVASSLNYLPKLAESIQDAVASSNLTKANTIQKYLRSVLETIYRYGDCVPSAKAAMNILTPINVGGVRYPGVSIWQDKILKMKGDLEKLHSNPS